MIRFEIFRDTAGGYRWRLVAANNEKVAGSESYVAKQGAIKAAQWLQSWAASARIVDLT